MFALPISKPRFKSITFFYQNSPKIKLFLQKKCKIFKCWGLRPHTPVPPAHGGFAPRPPKHPLSLRICGYAPKRQDVPGVRISLAAGFPRWLVSRQVGRVRMSRIDQSQNHSCILKPHKVIMIVRVKYYFLFHAGLLSLSQRTVRFLSGTIYW